MNSKKIIRTLAFCGKSYSERERDTDFKARETFRLSDRTSCISHSTKIG